MVKVILIVMGVIGIVPKLKKTKKEEEATLEEFSIRGNTENVQFAAVLMYARILEKVVEI